MHLYLAAIPGTGTSLHQAAQFAAGNECRDTMRFCLQPFRQFSNMGEFASGKTLDVKQQQVLQWRGAVSAGRGFGKTLEFTYLIAKFGQTLEVGFFQYPIIASILHGLLVGYLISQCAISRGSTCEILRSQGCAGQAITCWY